MNAIFPIAVEAVMIDLDGTLLDTIPDLAAATNGMLEELGLGALPLETVRNFVGKGIPRLVERALARDICGHVAPEALAAALPVFERAYAGINGRHTTIYPGVREGLEQMRAAGFRLACVTNKAGAFTLPLLERTGLAPFFELTVSGDTLPRKKPDPMQLLHACERFGVAPARMLMVGDSGNDVQAARAAGCPVFCVPYGYNEGHDVQSLDVDAIVGALTDCIPLIQKI
ncbi:MAG: phosphoglycolate phosphatase [Betaproteobacteria bacterium]|jgi:phosphoglycolate phosphatase|nr:phosphoglycolate phosphatase [Betaproteobacteria bacterium]